MDNLLYILLGERELVTHELNELKRLTYAQINNGQLVIPSLKFSTPLKNINIHSYGRFNLYPEPKQILVSMGTQISVILGVPPPTYPYNMLITIGDAVTIYENSSPDGTYLMTLPNDIYYIITRDNAIELFIELNKHPITVCAIE